MNMSFKDKKQTAIALCHEMEVKLGSIPLYNLRLCKSELKLEQRFRENLKPLIKRITYLEPRTSKKLVHERTRLEALRDRCRVLKNAMNV